MIRNLETASHEKSGSGSGSMQMHADFREQYKDKVNYLDRESSEHGYLIDSLLKQVASLEEQIQQHDEDLRNHGLLSPQETTSRKGLG
jgi:hypothetical protein